MIAFLKASFKCKMLNSSDNLGEAYRRLIAVVSMIGTIVTDLREKCYRKIYKMALGAHDISVSILQIILYSNTWFIKGRTWVKFILPPSTSFRRYFLVNDFIPERKPVEWPMVRFNWFQPKVLVSSLLMSSLLYHDNALALIAVYVWQFRHTAPTLEGDNRCI
jgi:hypothetical protein